MSQNKIWAVVALVVAGGALGFIAFGNLGENLVYYWSPTEMHDHGEEAVGATIRLGGLVAPGSVKSEGGSMQFTVTDNTTSVQVHTTEIPPAMFREGIGVVVEGSLASDGTFESKRLMVKHDADYKAPTAGGMPDQKAMFGTLADGSSTEPTPPGAAPATP